MISIIICTYNRAELLRQVLSSLHDLKESSASAAEILVVDNNSKDGTKEIVQAFTASSRWPARYFFETRQGLSYARNTGIQNAAGEYIAFLDDDVTVDPHWLTALERCFKETKADMVGGKIVRKWDFEPPSWYSHEIGGCLIAQDYGRARTNHFEKGRYLIGANMAFRKSMLEKIGKFDVSLGRKGNSLIGGEDRDIFEKVQKAGGEIWYEPEAIVAHPVEKNRLTQAYMKQWFYEVGRTRGYQMEWRRAHYFSLLPAWEWRDFLRAVSVFFASLGKDEKQRFASGLWLRHHFGILTERFFRWLPFGLGKKFSVFKEK